jgi:hypothetical protein
MGLLMICPHCQTKLPLACRACLGCGANLRDLPLQDRHYFIGDPGTRQALPSAPEAFLETNEVDVIAPHPKNMMPETPSLENKDVSLCEALDRILNKGAVLFGEVMISVADIDLVYLGLQVILASMETARGLTPSLCEGQLGPNLFDKGAY